MDITQLNGLAILVASLAAFALGGLWYGPLFGKQWQRLAELTDEEIRQGQPGKIYAGAFCLNLVMATALALLLQLHPSPDLTTGINTGVLLALSFIATSIGINYLFLHRPMAQYLIEAGYMVALMALMGAILGVWR